MTLALLGPALRIWKEQGNTTQLESSYVGTQAAIAGHCYDVIAPLIPGFEGSIRDDGTPNIYLSYPPTGVPYLGATAISGTAGSFVNFYNRDDWALTGNSLDPFSDEFPLVWMANQWLKPQNTKGYGYNPIDGFFAIGPRFLKLPQDRYEVFAYGAEARSFALGSMEARSVFLNNNVNLASEFGFGPEHLWHSGQFRSSLAKRRGYWERLLTTIGIQPITP